MAGSSTATRQEFSQLITHIKKTLPYTTKLVAFTPNHSLSATLTVKTWQQYRLSTRSTTHNTWICLHPLEYRSPRFEQITWLWTWRHLRKDDFINITGKFIDFRGAVWCYIAKFSEIGFKTFLDTVSCLILGHYCVYVDFWGLETRASRNHNELAHVNRGCQCNLSWPHYNGVVHKWGHDPQD